MASEVDPLYGASQKRPWYENVKVWLVIGAFVLAGLAVIVPLAVIFGRSASLITSVRVDSIRQHLQALQTIGTANGGNRETLGTGFNASVDYVLQHLVGAGYAPTRQPFSFGYFESVAAPVLVVANVSLPPTVFVTLRLSGSGSVSGAIWSVGTGCAASDYPPAFTAGDVALVFDSSACTLAARIAVATGKAAGAFVLSFAPGARSPSEQLQGFALASLPLLGLQSVFGQAIATGSNGAAVRIQTATSIRTAYSSNVIAETAGGDGNNVVVIGAHLDSVAAGPGINDNGSGSATVLTIAVELARLQLSPVSKIRFVFFGAEEKGLLGSTYYVSSLQGDARFQIAMMLNFDMIGSPNYFLGVYNGTSSSKASGVIQAVFEQYAQSRGIATEPTPFTGRSDYGPFLALAPCGGLFAGAEEIKNGAQRKAYGGMDRVAFDSCYHQACDTIDNISWDALGQTSELAAFAVSHFGFKSNIRTYLGSSV